MVIIKNFSPSHPSILYRIITFTIMDLLLTTTQVDVLCCCPRLLPKHLKRNNQSRPLKTSVPPLHQRAKDDWQKSVFQPQVLFRQQHIRRHHMVVKNKTLRCPLSSNLWYKKCEPWKTDNRLSLLPARLHRGHRPPGLLPHGGLALHRLLVLVNSIDIDNYINSNITYSPTTPPPCLDEHLQDQQLLASEHLPSQASEAVVPRLRIPCGWNPCWR